jgi:hypothetical protein
MHQSFTDDNGACVKPLLSTVAGGVVLVCEVQFGAKILLVAGEVYFVFNSLRIL